MTPSWLRCISSRRSEQDLSSCAQLVTQIDCPCTSFELLKRAHKNALQGQEPAHQIIPALVVCNVVAFSEAAALLFLHMSTSKSTLSTTCPVVWSLP